MIQVQGNKRTRIYLTGHGNETVKVYFLDPLSSRTRTCKWIQKVVLQKRSRMYYTVEMALDRGVTSPPPKLYRAHPTTFSFCSFLMLFYSKKGNNTERQQRINNIEKMSRKTRESQSSSIRPLEDISSCCLDEQTVSFVSLSFLSLAPCGFTTVFMSLQFWHEGSGAVNMQDKEWLTQLPTRLFTSSWTPLPAPPSPDSKLYVEQNKKQTKKTKTKQNKKHVL